jgi:hypothetical protein
MDLLEGDYCTSSSIGERFYYLNNIFVSTTFMRFIVLCVLEKNFVHISTGILEQLVGTVKDD